MNWDNVTRRKVLAGLGATGAASVGGLAVFTEPSLAYQNAMELSTTSNGDEDNDLLVEWVETYRGDVLEEGDTGNVVAGPNGPLIQLSNVLPGDYGSLCVRMTAQGTSDVEPQFAFDLNEEMTGENGLNEPEEAAGDTTPDEGELQDFVDVSIWYDSGLGGIDLFGGRNCSRDFGESLMTPNSSGTVAEVAGELSDGISVTDGCIGEDDPVEIALRWEFDDDGDINVTQTDRVGFDLVFGLEDCS